MTVFGYHLCYNNVGGPKDVILIVHNLNFCSSGTAVMPYLRLKLFRSMEVSLSPSSSLPPAGIAGIVKVTLSIASPIPYHAPLSLGKGTEEESDVDYSMNQVRSLDQRYCVLLDGIYTFLPPYAAGTGTTRAVGSIENRSTRLSGYVISKVTDRKISLQGSKGESTSFLLELETNEDCLRWLNVLAAHVEHVDSMAGSRWLF